MDVNLKRSVSPLADILGLFTRVATRTPVKSIIIVEHDELELNPGQYCKQLPHNGYRGEGGVQRPRILKTRHSIEKS